MTFEEWKAKLAVELSKTFDLEGGVVSGEQYIKDTNDDEYWREMFDDGLTPSDAASEEATRAAEAKRTADMPDEKSAIDALFSAWLRLRELGWREAMYCPKDGSHFQTIEAGSTSIGDCNYQGEWASGSFWLYDDHDVWPSHPILFKLYPADQVKYDARMTEAKARYSQICEEENNCEQDEGA